MCAGWRPDTLLHTLPRTERPTPQGHPAPRVSSAEAENPGPHKRDSIYLSIGHLSIFAVVRILNQGAIRCPGKPRPRSGENLGCHNSGGRSRHLVAETGDASEDRATNHPAPEVSSAAAGKPHLRRDRVCLSVCLSAYLCICRRQWFSTEGYSAPLQENLYLCPSTASRDPLSAPLHRLPGPRLRAPRPLPRKPPFPRPRGTRGRPPHLRAPPSPPQGPPSPPPRPPNPRLHRGPATSRSRSPPATTSPRAHLLACVGAQGTRRQGTGLGREGRGSGMPGRKGRDLGVGRGSGGSGRMGRDLGGGAGLRRVWADAAGSGWKERALAGLGGRGGIWVEGRGSGRPGGWGGIWGGRLRRA